MKSQKRDSSGLKTNRPEATHQRLKLAELKSAGENVDGSSKQLIKAAAIIAWTRSYYTSAHMFWWPEID